MAEPDELKDALPGGAARVDALRAAGLKALDRAILAREAALQRERDRQTRRWGADHSRVRALADRIEAAAAVRRDLALEVARAETASPRVRPEEWALHGYVRWKDLSPAPDLTVSLVDTRGRRMESLGSAHTDARGYFALVASVEHAAERTAAILSPYVRVTDAARKELHRGEEPLPVLPGVVDYVEIVLERGARVRAAPKAEPGTGPASRPRAARKRPES